MSLLVRGIGHPLTERAKLKILRQFKRISDILRPARCGIHDPPVSFRRLRLTTLCNKKTRAYLKSTVVFADQDRGTPFPSPHSSSVIGAQPAANNDTQYLGMTRPFDHRALMSVWGYSAFAVRYAQSLVAISLTEIPTYGS
jgi:hypothetical protein